MDGLVAASGLLRITGSNRQAENLTGNTTGPPPNSLKNSRFFPLRRSSHLRLLGHDNPH
jgi:hypothetical protein